LQVVAREPSQVGWFGLHTCALQVALASSQYWLALQVWATL